MLVLVKSQQVISIKLEINNQDKTKIILNKIYCGNTISGTKSTLIRRLKLILHSI